MGKRSVRRFPSSDRLTRWKADSSRLQSVFVLASIALLGIGGVGACERTDAWVRKGPGGGHGGDGSGLAAGGVIPTAGGSGTGSGGAPIGGSGGLGNATPTDYGAYQTASRSEVLGASARCATSLFAGFADAAGALEAATVDLSKAPTDVPTRAIAQQKFADALSLWSEAEVIGFGPAGPGPSSLGPTPGGRDLAPAIYGWPLVSRCEIDKTTLQKTYEAPDFPTKSLLTTRSLGALDYLLFYAAPDHGCGAAGGVAAPWSALSADDLAGRRAAYASVASADVATKARALASAWAPGQGGFETQLSSAGKGSAAYATERVALNAVSDALFHLDQRVKDTKLGHPLGLIDCAATSCPEGFESLWAGLSRESMRRNLLGFRRIATGCEPGGGGVGFDDLLASMGQKAAADRLRQTIEAAIAACDAVQDPSFVAALANERAKLDALRVTVKEITDFLRSDFVTLLDLELPKSLEGDND